MGNRIAVMTNDRKVVGELNTSLACFAIVNGLVEKYNKGASLMNPATVNDVLEVVYQNCEDYEDVQLLIFINDKSSFDKSDIPRLDKAINNYSMKNDGPKKHLVFIRNLIKEHGELITEYIDSTFAIAVCS